VVDFSQFKVRGHYENSELLKRYFKAMIVVLERTDMRVAGGKDENLSSSSPREMGAAIVLNDLLKGAKKFRAMATVSTASFRPLWVAPDSMTFAQLDAVLNKGGIKSPADVKNLDTIKALQDEILKGNHPACNTFAAINYVSTPFGSRQGGTAALVSRSWGRSSSSIVGSLPRLSQETCCGTSKKCNVASPSALDVAFAAFGNDATVPRSCGTQ